MPEGVGYGPQFTASTGLNLNYIGRYCYAYSGLVSSTSSGTDLLNQTDDMTYEVLLNGNGVQQWQCTGSKQPEQLQNTLDLIIPPYTNVIVKATSAGGAQTQTATFAGKVYGKVD